MSAMSEPNLDFDILWPEALENPWRFLLPIQASEPLFRSRHQDAWIVTRNADFKAAHLDKRLSSSRVDIYLRNLDPDIVMRCPTIIRSIPGILSFMDAPDHTRLRSIMVKAFMKPVVESMRERTREIVRSLLDNCEQKQHFNFMQEVAYELPSRVVMKIFGIPNEYQRDLNVMANSLSLALGTSKITPQLMQEFEDSTVKVFEILTHLIEQIETNPRDDLLTALVQARDEGRRLNNEELLNGALGVISAGFDTTAAAVGVFLKWISERPVLIRYIRENPGLIGNVVNELLRYPGLVKFQTRLAAEDFEWHGRHIKKGDAVYMSHFAANVDPEVFDRPFEIDPSRKTSEAVSFGHGAHHCIGFLLAKMELSEFLLSAFQRFDVSVPPQKLEYLSSYAFYGYKELQVDFQSRAET